MKQTEFYNNLGNPDQETKVIKLIFPPSFSIPELKKRMEIVWPDWFKKIPNKAEIERIYHSHLDDNNGLIYCLTLFGIDMGFLVLYNTRWPKKQKVQLLICTNNRHYDLLKSITDSFLTKNQMIPNWSDISRKDIEDVLPVIENYEIERPIPE